MLVVVWVITCIEVGVCTFMYIHVACLYLECISKQVIGFLLPIKPIPHLKWFFLIIFFG